jgi:hypothetical protein
MKTMKNGEEILKVSEDETGAFLKRGFKYCPKSEYKIKHGKGKANAPKAIIEKKEKKSKFSKKQQAEYEASKKAV